MIVMKEFAPVDIWKRKLVRATFEPHSRTWQPLDKLDFIPIFASVYSWMLPERGGEVNFSTPIVHDIIFDFDGQPGMLDAARREACDFVTYLMEIHDVSGDEFSVYFSGKKGFHVILPIECVVDMESTDGLWGIKPEVIKNFALDLVMGFKTVDHSVYDVRRILRLPNTRHPESGLFKVKLPEWFRDMSTADILNLAENPVEPTLEPVYEFTPSRSLYGLLLQSSETVTMSENDASKMSMRQIFDTAAPGERNNRATQLAGLLVKAIDDLPLIREVMALWNRQLPKPLSLHELDVITTGVYKRYHQRKNNKRIQYDVPGF